MDALAGVFVVVSVTESCGFAVGTIKALGHLQDFCPGHASKDNDQSGFSCSPGTVE
jgi:hypothetical protein